MFVINPTFHTLSQYDPTRTLTLRRQFSAQMYKRFRTLKGIIRKAIVEQDVLGLKEGLQTMQADLTPPGYQAYAFERAQDKIDDFMDWLREQEEKGILERKYAPQLGRAGEQPWTNTYIQQAYRQGVDRSRKEMIQAGYNVPDIEEQGGLDTVFNQPYHVDRVGLMYTRTFNELKGVTQAMDQQISRMLAQGIAEGINPREMAKNINDRIDKIGLTRARTIARTETIRAHHGAMVQEYKNWRVEGVKVKAEWDTAGDTRVCPICRPLDGNVYTVEEIEPMIPRHPNCRCISLPLDVTDEGVPTEEGVEGITSEPFEFESGRDTFYHGTSAPDFDEFDSSFLRTGADRGGKSWYGDGVYLSGEPWKGSMYSYAGSGGTPRVLTVRPRVTQPFVVRGTGAEDFPRALQKVGIENIEDLDSAVMTKILQDKGYDSVMVMKNNSNIVNELVVFDPKKARILSKISQKDFNVDVFQTAKVKAGLEEAREEVIEEVLTPAQMTWLDASKRNQIPAKLKEIGVEDVDNFAIPRSLGVANEIGRNLAYLQSECDYYNIKKITALETTRYDDAYWSNPFFGINSRAVQELMESTRKAEDYYFNVVECVSPEKRAKSLFDHEFGHVLASRKVTNITPSYRQNLDTWLEENYDLSKLENPSLYGGSNHTEWWAESWAAYKNGREDLLDPVFYEILDKWRLR